MQLSGNPSDFIIAFLGGLLTSFTPCIYPLIPISAGFIGIESATSKLKGFTLSLLYVTGLAVTYACLGMFAALSGRLFGEISSHPASYLVVGSVIIVFGFSMLGLFNIRLPNLIKQPIGKKQDYLSVFLLGLSSGFIVSPCLTPVLASILLYLATKRQLLYGATLLLSFAYGMGFVLILIGTFSAFILNKLPKSGRWMLYIKKVYSFLLIGFGLYFIYMGLRRL